MKSILAIFAIGLLLATAMSGCVGGEKTSGIDTTTGTDTGMGNETENQTATIVNKTESLGQNYTAEVDGTIVLDATGFDGIVIGEGSIASQSGGYLTLASQPSQIEIVVTYTSASGGCYLTIWVPGSDTNRQTFSSENDGGGVETILLKPKDLKKIDGAGDWLFHLYGGVLAGDTAPTANLEYHIKITVWNSPVEIEFSGLE
jgi:hypothetical protein